MNAGPPNKGMKLTKPGELRSFAAYPRCSTDVGRAPRCEAREDGVRLTGVMPVLRVGDLDRSVQFYRDVLLFDVAWRAANDGDGENCMLASGDVSLMLSTGSHLGGSPHLTGTLYFNATGVTELYERIRGSVELVWPLGDTEYGTLEFGIRDPDGYTLAFAETHDS